MNKQIQIGLSKVRALRNFAVVAGTTAAVAAHAALPTGVDTAVTGAGTDGGTLIGLLAAAGAGVFLIGKVLRKFGILL
jgi:hypothetical protein